MKGQMLVHRRADRGQKKVMGLTVLSMSSPLVPCFRGLPRLNVRRRITHRRAYGLEAWPPHVLQGGNLELENQSNLEGRELTSHRDG